jgi:hypothetical protein
VRYGPGKPSFNPLPTAISFNYIHATYGASQGVDNDGMFETPWWALVPRKGWILVPFSAYDPNF